MKLQELIEGNDNTIHFDTIDEYQRFLEQKGADQNMYHFEDVPGTDGNEYDVLVRVFDFNQTQGSGNMASAETPEDLYGSQEVDWNIVAYGTGDYDTDTNFWIKEGRLDISPEYQTYIENKLIEDLTY